MLNPQQKTLMNNLMNSPMNEQTAQQIADKLNSIGITKEQLQQLMSIKK